jgi:hypothetical protein
MDIDNTWFPTLLCALRDAIRYNDGLRNSQTIRDAEDIEEWMLQIFQFKEYLRDQLKANPEMLAQYRQYLDDDVSAG